jgi:hypothetical protein
MSCPGSTGPQHFAVGEGQRREEEPPPERVCEGAENPGHQEDHDGSEENTAEDHGSADQLPRGDDTGRAEHDVTDVSDTFADRFRIVGQERERSRSGGGSRSRRASSWARAATCRDSGRGRWKGCSPRWRSCFERRGGDASGGLALRPREYRVNPTLRYPGHRQPRYRGRPLRAPRQFPRTSAVPVRFA